ncbi:hypothetical protein ACRE_041020 [Hapsidospora chrysogenum ATCC 11550]|uniref:Uncharacterized protein n=1 Tax=Hapsidospora chrysogenum (strain ATCC 11550 / CBS 779.69 / DSM 880 / IAM 14645 / JCM 23072 / IMI 49137) TaxID=857340 RepID=A0A086T6S0_HAPC1|nr:hypothetical protein ACRE_041020 [Hapsidospora chrysogenum ATCC 11550]
MRSEFRGLTAATEPPAPSEVGLFRADCQLPSMYAYVFELSYPGAGGGMIWMASVTLDFQPWDDAESQALFLHLNARDAKLKCKREDPLC